MPTSRNPRYFIHPDSQTNESVIDVLRQASPTILERSLRCEDGKVRDLIEVTKDIVRLLRSEKARSILRYTVYRQIGVGPITEFNDREFDRQELRALTSLPKKPKTKEKAFAKMKAVRHVALGSDIKLPSFGK